MTEPLEKHLISAFSAAWNEIAPARFDRDSSLSLLALREVAGEQMAGALAVAMTWSAAFLAPGGDQLPGVIICLFKSEESAELDRLIKQPTDGLPQPGGRALLTSVLEDTAERMSETAPVSFGDVTYMDLTGNESRLSSIVGDSMWVGTFALTIADAFDSQALLLYAPQGTLAAEAAPSRPATVSANAAAETPAAPTAPPPVSRRPAPPRREEAPRNIERLLTVELNVVVRFGVTSIPLREVVRMGVGTMLELNRAVDEPVELLVNGRPLARGEVVVVDGYYGVRITEIGAPADRALALQ